MVVVDNELRQGDCLVQTLGSMYVRQKLHEVGFEARRRFQYSLLNKEHGVA